MRALAIVATAGRPDDQSDPLDAARRGDLAAFDQVMREHQRLVFVTALRLLGNLGDAQDASQEVFLKLYRNLAKVGPDNLAGWLYRVTVNVCHDFGRKRPPLAAVEAALEVPASGEDPRESMVAAERRRVLELSLRMLPEKERAALVLRDLEGLPTKEVARVLGSSEVTVRSQVSKARIKVRDFMERYFRRRA